MPINQENLGPAERIIQSVLAYHDHCVHNRPGLVVADPRQAVGVRWNFVTHKVENEQKNVYLLKKVGKKTVPERVGALQPDGKVYAVDAQGVIARPLRLVGEYRKPGLFPEVVTWLYKQVADIWRLDNEFAARWASYQYGLEHKDLKVVLAAFMLVQSRKGEPVMENGACAFHDDDFRDVGEAMMLTWTGKKDAKELNPKLLLRIREVLEVPGVAAINRELGFGKSAREPALGRWNKAVHKWLLYREENPKLLEGLVKAGFRSTVIRLCSRSGYKPTTPKFFKTLRSKQAQAADGRRVIAIGEAVAAAETWEGLTEEQVCERIVKQKPNYKRIVGLVPSNIGITRAVMAAAIEAGALSDKDLVMATPTIEELGLMAVQEVRERWEGAVRRADDMRAANIAGRVKNEATKQKLEAAAETAVQKATEEVMKGMRVFVYVDRSGSMEPAREAAIRLLTKLLPAFPPDKLHAAYFNTTGQEVTFKSQTGAGVEQAFRGVTASGGTDYGSGIRALAGHKPGPDEDVLMIFVGDQQALLFDGEVRAAGQNPMAFGFVYTPGSDGAHYQAVEHTAAQLRIPCFRIDEKTFEDTYAIPRTIRALVAATPVGAATRMAAVPRVSLAETVLATPLLKKPSWAA